MRSPEDDMSIEPVAYSAEVKALVSSSGLPVSDLDERPQLRLFGVRLKGKIIGLVGIEVYETVGLLRSLAVDPEFRHSGYARALVIHAETWAAQHQVEKLYLLTTTAADFFAHLGYKEVSRVEAPKAIAQTTQFVGLCPSSATFMRKKLASVL